MFLYLNYEKNQRGNNMLKRIWNYLFYACKHKWIIIDNIPVYRQIVVSKHDLPRYHKLILQCEHCGDIKVKRT